VFQRGGTPQVPIQLWVLDASGSGQIQLTNTAGINLSPQWGVRMVTPGDELNGIDP
jgi:hypothetical protein